MSLSTVAAIRDRLYSLIEAITPTSPLNAGFRRYRNEGAADFRTDMEGNVAGAFRRVQVREVGDDDPPDVSNMTEERVRVTFEIAIAYPQTHRYGRDNAMDRDDVINEDWRLINAAVGVYGRANFAGAYDCTPLGATKTRETGEGVDFLVLTAEYEYVREVVEAVEEFEVTWTVDDTSIIGVPKDATEWGDLLDAIDLGDMDPSHLYLMQQTSGNLADSIGSLTLSTGGFASYQNAVAGWSRKAFRTSNGSGIAFVNAGSGPNASSTSVAVLAYVHIASASSSERVVFQMSDDSGDSLSVNMNTSGQYKAIVGDNSATMAASHTASTHPVLLVYDRTNSRAALYTDREKLSVTYDANVVDGRKSFGASSPPKADFLYAAWFEGTAAEVTDAQVKALLEALGWTVAWS